MAYIDDPAVLAEDITSLVIELKTVNAGDAESDDELYVNVVFEDGTRLYEPKNRAIGSPPGIGPSKQIVLPIPSGLNRTLGSSAELFVRKDGDDGWFARRILLFANGHSDPLIGSRGVNQFLDNDHAVLLLRDWSTASFCVAPATHAEHPLPRSGYRVLGPVIGQVSATTASVLYRVDRAGTYRFRAVDSITSALVANQTTVMEPSGRFSMIGLQPDRQYDFDLHFVRAGVETRVPGAAGSLRTYPQEGSRGRFAMAFGSCANPREQVPQAAWTGIRSLAESPPDGIEPVHLFVHLGDTFYFYDDMTEETVKNRRSMRGAHVSMRRHLEFLDMARVVPCCGIWDDHDFAGNNTYSTHLTPTLREQAVEVWREYWGNDPAASLQVPHGLTTRISHGRVDIYLLDGRIERDPANNVCFGMAMIRDLLTTIRRRGAIATRVVVLATGSNWNHMSKNAENYGDSAYETEREFLFRGLGDLMGTAISGLVFISGDDHKNEVFQVDLGNGRTAPEFVSSPFTMQPDLEDVADLEGERIASLPAKERRGFATLTVDASRAGPEGNWTAVVRYYQEAAAIPYASFSYVVSGGQFVPL